MKVDYGVRALVDLAQRYGGGFVHTVEIAESQSIPEPYQDQLLTTLSKFEFIRSRRGPQGGHVLAKAPNEISLGMVMAGLEGTVTSLDCITEPTECTLSNICAQRDVGGL
jgi:Rrf2 family protein